jgi:Fe2+ or Zn2+ uptake regulation protein
MSCGERLARELRAEGYRVTPQRAVILETVAHASGHRSAQEVFERARQRLPGLNLATVYRTLETLDRAGLVDLLSTGSQPMRFSLHDPSRPHAHLVCRSCGGVCDIDLDLFTALTHTVASRHGFTLDRDHIVLTGLCEACRKGRGAATEGEGGVRG